MIETNTRKGINRCDKKITNEKKKTRVKDIEKIKM